MDELEITLIRVDLQQQGYLGLNEELRCLGFFPKIELDGSINVIHYYYAVCVQGLDTTDSLGNVVKGELIQTRTIVKDYTDANLRPDLDENNDPIFDTQEVDDVDENGNVIGVKTIQVMRMIGAVSFWMKKLGNQYIIPDLQFTLEQIAPTHKQI